MRAAVIGHPVGHSISPLIFSFLSKELGRQNLDYKALDVAPNELATFVKNLRSDMSWAGVNVTIPHKEKIIQYVDDLTPAVTAIGACNVIERRDQKICAHNTDVIGIEESLREHGFDLSRKDVLILGSGGAARAAAYACANGGAKSITVFNRTSSRAEMLVNEFASKFSSTRFLSIDSLQSKVVTKFDLVIQSTPVGMTGYQSKEPFPSLQFMGLFDVLPANTVFYDLIYKPLKTPFLIEAEARGHKTIGGLSMLIAQALASWEIWFGPMTSKEVLRNLLSAYLTRTLAEAL